MFTKCGRASTEETRILLTTPNSLYLLITFLDTVLQLFVSHVLKASNSKEGKLQALSAFRDAVSSYATPSAKI